MTNFIRKIIAVFKEKIYFCMVTRLLYNTYTATDKYKNIVISKLYICLKIY